MSSAYIVDTEILTVKPPNSEWHAHEVPSDPTKSLLVVRWMSPKEELEFESLIGVMPLGDPWEPLPTEAVALLASFSETPAQRGAALGSIDAPAITVGAALRQTGWPGARLD